MSRPVTTVTFDLWDTLILDDSDEPRRAAAGLLPKAAARVELIEQALATAGQEREPAVVLAASRGVEAAGRWAWHELHVNWTMQQRLGAVLSALEADLPEPAMAELVRAWEEMELNPMPDLVPGAAEMLQALADQYQLAVVSDAIVSPGRVLRTILERHDVLRYFCSFAFSDEVGASKPNRAMFEHVARETDGDLTAMVHIGDRQHNDIAGAQRAGMRAVLFVGASERSLAAHSADAVCGSLAKLPGIIAALARADGSA